MDRVSTTEANSTDEYERFRQDLGSDPSSIDELFPTESGERNQRRQGEYYLRQAWRQLQQIAVAAQSFSWQLDFDKLLVEIASHGYEILRSDQVIVYSQIDNQLRPEVVFPFSQSTLDARQSGFVNRAQRLEERPDLPGEDARWCVRYLKPKVSNGIDGRIPNVRNSICAPFVSSQNRVLGVIEFRNKRTGGMFTEQDMRVANCLTQVATSAIDRARLFHRMEEWQRSIETLLSFNATVNQQLEPEEMVRELVANVTSFLESDGGAAGIVIHEESGPVAACDSFFFDGRWHDYHRRWRPKEGIPGIVMETEFPFLINDYEVNVAADPRLVKEFDIGSCICVPIKNAHEEVLGFFKLHRRRGQPEFTWQDAAFLESLGNTAAVAIENARLMKSLELKNAQIKSLSENHVRRLELERQHIARELHDETGQVLIGLKLRLQVLAGLLTEEQADAKQELAALRVQVNDATAQLKDLAKRLRPPTLDELGFEATLRQLVAEFRRQVDFGIRLEIQSQPDLASEAETALYRIVQESLTNVAKHADASQVVITFSRSGNRQVFCIRDDGCGFDPNSTTKGLGLVGIHERVKMLGASVEIVSRTGRGTAIEVSITSRAEP